MYANIVFLLIPGFGSSSTWFEYKYDAESKKIVPLTFVKNLKQLGHVYFVTFNFFNVDYYYKNSDPAEEKLWKTIYKKYKPHTQNIDFTLKDLDHYVICKKNP